MRFEISAHQMNFIVTLLSEKADELCNKAEKHNFTDKVLTIELLNKCSEYGKEALGTGWSEEVMNKVLHFMKLWNMKRLN